MIPLFFYLEAPWAIAKSPRPVTAATDSGLRLQMKSRGPGAALFFPRVGDLHGFHFALAAVFVVLHAVMIGIGHLYHFAKLCFHSGHHLVVAVVGECLRGG